MLPYSRWLAECKKNEFIFRYSPNLTMTSFTVSPVMFRNGMHSIASKTTALVPFIMAKGYNSFAVMKQNSMLYNACIKLEPLRHKLLFIEFNNTTAHSFDKSFINMSRMMRKYKISGSKLLFHMSNRYNDVNINNMDWVTAESITKNGIVRFGNTFQYGIPNETPQVIDIKSYDKYNGRGAFYGVAAKLLTDEMEFGFYKGQNSIRNIKTLDSIGNANKYLLGLGDIIKNKTTHYQNDMFCDVTELVKEYKITPEELYASFLSLDYIDTKYKGLYRMKLNVKICKEILERNNYYIADINTRFALDDKQVIHVPSINKFYECLAKLIYNKIMGLM